MSKAGSTVEKKINKVQFNAKVTAFILGAFNLLTLILVSIVFISVLSYERQYIAVYTRNIEIVFSAISLAISLFIEIYCVCFIRNQMSKEKEMKENNDLFNYNPQIVKNRISFTFPFISIMFICFLVMIGHEGLRITIYGVDYIFILSILAILLIMVSLLYITVKISTMNFKKKDFSLP